MIKAIHKKSGKLVPAFKLESNDATWLGKEKDEWIAPFPEIDNWKFLKEKGIKEVFVSFVKSHIRNIEGIDTMVKSHFRIITEGAIPSPINESEEHKLAKKGIYEDILDNKLIINKKRIRDLFEIEDIDFEFKLTSSKYSKIADVILLFKQKDEVYGKGIVFEIQLSNQTFENTKERTYDRVLEGYSVVWLWDGMFSMIDHKLLKKEIEVIPFLKACEEYKELKKLEFYNEINLYGELLEKKGREIIQDIETIQNKVDINHLSLLKSQESFQNKLNVISDQILKIEKERIIDELRKVYTEQLSKIIHKDEVKKEILASLDYNYLIDIISEKEINLLRDKLQKYLEKEITEELKSKLTKEIILEEVSKKAEEIKEQYKLLKISGEMSFNCEKCDILLPYKLCEFECGKVYCPDCFDSLEDNWRKASEKFSKEKQNPRWDKWVSQQKKL